MEIFATWPHLEESHFAFCTASEQAWASQALKTINDADRNVAKYISMLGSPLDNVDDNGTYFVSYFTQTVAVSAQVIRETYLQPLFRFSSAEGSSFLTTMPFSFASETQKVIRPSDKSSNAKQSNESQKPASETKSIVTAQVHLQCICAATRHSSKKQPSDSHQVADQTSQSELVPAREFGLIT